MAETGQEIPSSELSLMKKDGSRVVVFSSHALVRKPGRPTEIFCIDIDITGLKRAEEAREYLMDELARKNVELDRFTYTVSHDLRSPLMSIRGFLSLLEADLKTGDFTRVKTDVIHISDSAEKLELLITTLLALSRSGRTVDTPVRIPFTDLAREAAGLLEVTLRTRGVTLVIPDDMPVIYGDRQRLLQVMVNLIDNAVKFMGGQDKPRIEAGLRSDTGTRVFFVRDNGSGIRKENLPKVFGLFERFNPDVPGTGIGLATVKRIIEAHGGKIWVESEGEGMGTTVCFTLPDDEACGTDNNNSG
jgi:signal transduction histidine kinase